MNRKLQVLILLGVFSMVTMSFMVSAPAVQSSSTAAITIWKGQVYNLDKDRYWEKVTFGMSGADPEDYFVMVKILDKQGRLITIADNFDLVEGKYLNWYSLELEDYNINQDFYLEIHFVYKTACQLQISTLSSFDTRAAGSPIDPEETVLIVKYP